MSRLAAIDPGRSKCGLVLADADAGLVLAAAILPPQACLAQLRQWQPQQVILGDGTGSGSWPPQLAALNLPLLLVPEAGTTLAARQRYWQLVLPHLAISVLLVYLSLAYTRSVEHRMVDIA